LDSPVRPSRKQFRIGVRRKARVMRDI
jgi:hypothetical protein